MPSDCSAAPDNVATFNFGELRNPRQLGTLHAHAGIIVIHEGALEAILDYAEADTTRERGGFLLGGVYGESPQFSVIRHFHPALAAEGDSSSLKFTHETWAALTREIEAQFSGELLLGWQHTHPGMGIFLSANDLFIQRNFFTQSWQVALVVDPKRREFGFFQWRDGEVRDCGFVCAEL